MRRWRLWRRGSGLAGLSHHEEGEWVYNDRTGLTQDILSYAKVADVVSNRRHQTSVLARIGDSEAERTGSDFPERWRRFLAGLNLFQFIGGFRFWASSEVDAGTAPELAHRSCRRGGRRMAECYECDHAVAASVRAGARDSRIAGSGRDT